MKIDSVVFFVPITLIVIYGVLDFTGLLSRFRDTRSKLERASRKTINISTSTSISINGTTTENTLQIKVDTIPRSNKVTIETSTRIVPIQKISKSKTKRNPTPKNSVSTTTYDDIIIIPRKDLRDIYNHKLPLSKQLADILITTSKESTQSKRYRIPQEKQESTESTREDPTLNLNRYPVTSKILRPFLDYWIPPHNIKPASHKENNRKREKRSFKLEYPPPSSKKFNRRLSDGTPYFVDEEGGVSVGHSIPKIISKRFQDDRFR